MRWQSSIIAAAVVTIALSSTSQAALVLYYNMNDLTLEGQDPAFTKENVVGVPTLDQLVNGGTSLATPSSGVAFVDAESTAHAAGNALTWDSGVNDPSGNNNGVLLSFSAQGWNDMTLRFDYRTTSTGPASLTLEYQVAGGGYNLVSSPALTNDSTFRSLSFDLSSISAIENVAGVDLRVRWTDGSGTGTARLDNLQLTGTEAVIPEPGSAMLLALGGLALLRRRR